MRKLTKEEETMKIGKMNISFKPYDSNNALVTLTSNARGFKTTFRFPLKSAKRFYMFLSKNNTINNSISTFELNCIQIKHREYTKTIGVEDCMSMKYFNTQNGMIKVTCIDGCTVIRISGPDKMYEHFCYDTNDFINTIDQNRQKINLMIGEYMMNNWN